MDDALLVRGLERLGDLSRDRESLRQRDRSLGDAIRQRRPVDQLHDQCMGRARVLKTVEVRDVRMVQRGEDLRFAAEAHEPIGIRREGVGQNLQRDDAIELGVAGAVDLAHPARANGGDDFVGA